MIGRMMKRLVARAAHMNGSTGTRKRAGVRGRWWVAVALALVVAAAAAWTLSSSRSGHARFATAAVTRGSVESTVLAAGTLQPYEYVDVGAQTSGQLRALKVKLGENVVKGQLLAEIDPVVSAAKVVEAEATLSNLEAQLELNREQLNLALQQKKRAEQLLKADAVAAAEAEIATSNYKVALARIDALRAQINQARAALDTARANLGYTRITAPMSGQVVAIKAREGQTLNASQQAPTIMRIAELDVMTVWAQVSEADVARLKIGQEGYFTVLGEPDRRWPGRLRQILPSPEVINNVIFYNALFDVPNPSGELKIQMTVQAFFVVAKADDALYVPLAALTADRGAGAGRYTARVLGPDGTIEQRVVQVGVRNSISGQVLSGLREGETVITGDVDSKKDEKKSAQKAKLR